MSTLRELLKEYDAEHRSKMKKVLSNKQPCLVRANRPRSMTVIIRLIEAQMEFDYERL